MNRLPRTSALQSRVTLPALTGVRFFAAFYVVLFHALPWLSAHFTLPDPLRTFLSNGYLAVALFFLLSGFILAYTYEGHVDGPRNWAKFWEARFARIYPVYFLSLLLALPFQSHLTLASSFSVVAMVQAWNPLHPEWTGAWNYPAWSLSVEGFFYLCFPFLQKLVSRFSSRALTTCIIVAGLICVLGHTPMQGLGNWGLNTTFSRFLPLPLLRIPEFILGISLGNYFLRRGSVCRGTVSTALASVAVVILLSLPIGPWVSLVVVPFGFLIFDLADPENSIGALLSTRLMVLLGGASYSIYLLQAPFRDWVRALSDRAPHNIAKLGTPLTPILLVGFSIIVFKVWEEPLRRTIRRWFAAKPV
jgi:peptidoglycan/LPS O-acetylase OafA/YrhL